MRVCLGVCVCVSVCRQMWHIQSCISPLQPMPAQLGCNNSFPGPRILSTAKKQANTPANPTRPTPAEAMAKKQLEHNSESVKKHDQKQTSGGMSTQSPTFASSTNSINLAHGFCNPVRIRPGCHRSCRCRRCQGPRRHMTPLDRTHRQPMNGHGQGPGAQ